LSIKNKRVFRRQRKLSRSRAGYIKKKSSKIKRLITRKKIYRSRVTGRVVRRPQYKKRVHLVIKKKKRVQTRKIVQKITLLKKRKSEKRQKKILPPKKRKQIIRVTERRKFSTRLDFSKTATVLEKFKYLLKQIKRGMILRFVIKAPKGKGSPTKRAKKTGKVICRSPYISTGWINFGSISPERIEYYLEQLGGINNIERIFYMPKR
jgi:hypothetical protein